MLAIQQLQVMLQNASTNTDGGSWHLPGAIELIKYIFIIQAL